MGVWIHDDFKLGDDQLRVVRELAAKRRALLIDATGNGKCIPGDAHVHFNGGYPMIKDILPGAVSGFTLMDGRAMSSAGDVSPVDAFYVEHGVSVFNWSTRFGRMVRGTGKHKVLVIRGGESIPRMCRLDTLVSGDYILRPTFMVPDDTLPVRRLVEQSILYGILLGDGCLSKSYSSRISYLGTEATLKWVRSTEMSYSPEWVSGARVLRDSRTQCWYFGYPRSRSVTFPWIGSTPMDSSSKFIHSDVFSLSARYRFLVLYGYLSADGSHSAGSVEFSTKSPSLRDGLCALMESLNITFAVYPKHLPSGTHYRVRMHRRGRGIFLAYCDQWLSSTTVGCPHFYRLWNGSKVSEPRYLLCPSNDKNSIHLDGSTFLGDFKRFLDANRSVLPYRLRRLCAVFTRNKSISVWGLSEVFSLIQGSGLDVPTFISDLCGYEFDPLVSCSKSVEDVYDLSVPSDHLFVGQGCINHNTACGLYGVAWLLHKDRIDNALITIPVNGYTKKIWPIDIKRLTNMTYILWEDFVSAFNRGDSVDDILSRYHLVIMKHGAIKSDFKVLRHVYASLRRILTVVDEVHAFKGPTTELTKTARILLDHSYALWGLTATSLSRNCEDVYHLLNFVCPNFLGSFIGFRDRFCVTRDKVIGRNAFGGLRTVKDIVDWKDSNALMEFLKDVLVLGSPSLPVEMHFVDYVPGEREERMYSRISAGFSSGANMDDANWAQLMLSRSAPEESAIRSIKDVERFSSRYIYLQSVVDGSLNDDGTFGLNSSAKSDALLGLVAQIAARGESLLLFCAYYTTMDNVAYTLAHSGLTDKNGNPVRVVEQSSRNGFKAGVVSEAMCARNSYVVLCSPGATESANYYYVNNVGFYNMPETPKTYLQMLGRITRRTTLFRDNLHCWIFRSPTIDEYKLHMVGFKLYMQTPVSYKVENFPSEYIKPAQDGKRDQLALAKKYLLWGGKQVKSNVKTLF